MKRSLLSIVLLVGLLGLSPRPVAVRCGADQGEAGGDSVRRCRRNGKWTSHPRPLYRCQRGHGSARPFLRHRPQQRLDVYIPPGQGCADPVHGHGGAWMLGDKGASNFVSKSRAWIPRAISRLDELPHVEASQPARPGLTTSPRPGFVQAKAHRGEAIQARCCCSGIRPGRIWSPCWRPAAHCHKPGWHTVAGHKFARQRAYDLVEIMQGQTSPHVDRVFARPCAVD